MGFLSGTLGAFAHWRGSSSWLIGTLYVATLTFGMVALRGWHTDSRREAANLAEDRWHFISLRGAIGRVWKSLKSARDESREAHNRQAALLQDMGDQVERLVATFRRHYTLDVHSAHHAHTADAVELGGKTTIRAVHKTGHPHDKQYVKERKDGTSLYFLRIENAGTWPTRSVHLLLLDWRDSVDISGSTSTGPREVELLVGRADGQTKFNPGEGPRFHVCTVGRGDEGWYCDPAPGDYVEPSHAGIRYGLPVAMHFMATAENAEPIEFLFSLSLEEGRIRREVRDVPRAPRNDLPIGFHAHQWIHGRVTVGSTERLVAEAQRVRLTNKTPQPMSVSLALVLGRRGDFAIHPERFSVPGNECAEVDRVVFDLGGEKQIERLDDARFEDLAELFIRDEVSDRQRIVSGPDLFRGWGG